MSKFRTAALAALALASEALAQFTITTTNDTGPGSLRNAILAANLFGGPAIVNFNVPGGGTIHLGSDLPILTDPGGISINGANGGAGAIVIDGGATSNATGYRAFFVGVGAGE